MNQISNKVFCKKFLSAGNSCCWSRIVRFFADKKKFFKEARISELEEGYGINLDNHELKTPTGSVLCIPNENLAQAVTLEWNIQKHTIKTERMPLTALCYAACLSHSKEPTVSSILSYLTTDTVLCHSTEPEELVQLQDVKWGPAVEWFKARYSVDVSHSNGFIMPDVDRQTKLKMNNYLLTHDAWCLIGLESMVGLLKSVILSLAVVNYHLTVEDAVSLSRLEQEYQVAKWGNVEWYHDVEKHEMQMKTAACALFFQMCAEQTTSISYTSQNC
ncbi:unnamed protein product [Clavelina lepadiformis]|uniref:ATP synthase mitochondrial F1 complex assembly factor 2 n=1 Tax=Clavelina lepadiformis TaxID=159417 RepID=A0ABP0G0C5_CLALP